MKHMEEICRYLTVLSQQNILDLGMVLGISYPNLKDYKQSAPQQFLYEVVAAWLRKQDFVIEKGRTPTWHNLVKALRDDTVRQNGIADDISKDKQLSKQ